MTKTYVLVDLPNEPMNPLSFVPAGWGGIVAELVADLDRLAPGWQVYTMGSVGGRLALRPHLAPLTPPDVVAAVYNRILAAQRQSGLFCDVCGGRAEIWQAARCGYHLLDEPVDAHLVARVARR